MAPELRSSRTTPWSQWDLGELRTAPNLLSLLRILLVPAFLATYLAGEVAVAAVVFAVAAASDLLDGMLARLLRQRTALGAILDPTADKLLGLSALAALVAKGALPAWLLVLSLTRDLVVVAVAVAARWEGARLPTSPTRIGKYATFFTNTAVVLALIGEISYAPLVAGYAFATAVIAAECLVVAAAQYAGRYAARETSAGEP
ncbi:MAG: CDP-alcohol phosphatidyltransferase family protein [Deltaproteobacteria bacterium]|nr:CDP-alcohol phosphatidyltransferase family protein [Deltaproteobacteria bacterium]